MKQEQYEMLMRSRAALAVAERLGFEGTADSLRLICAELRRNLTSAATPLGIKTLEDQKNCFQIVH